ncbi:HNH endonuclease signature motif containing protein [Streptomyces sp. NPDC002855]|uniref:HNH endonuclease n=1 Tax=Streptomyces sp. NPDC002855 TaxID=3154437 RepID=UPI0033329615
MRVRCLDCREWATVKGRCPVHHKAYENTRSRQSHRKRRAAIARGQNAAAITRKALRKAGQGQCVRCLGVYRASLIDVDHVTPLAKGGEDVASNVQLLCKTCHKRKTAEDFDHKTLPF